MNMDLPSSIAEGCFAVNQQRDNRIYVTRPSLPPLDEFVESLREIWDSRWLTNNGPFHQRFEAELAEMEANAASETLTGKEGDHDHAAND